MSLRLTLRALVSARLTAAAEDIFALFERTIAEYEQQLRQTQKTGAPQLLHRDCAADSPGDMHGAPGSLHNAGVQTALGSSDTEPPRVKEEPQEEQTAFGSSATETLLVKEELQEEQRHLQLSVCVKSEEEPAEQTQMQGDYISAETWGQMGNDEDWTAPLNCSEAEAYGDYSDYRAEYAPNSAPFGDFSPAPEPSVSEWSKDAPTDAPTNTPTDAPTNTPTDTPTDTSTDTSTDAPTNTPTDTPRAPLKKHQCPLCFKTFLSKSILERHSTVHSGEKPFSCSVCNKRFNTKSYLVVHLRSHTGERPYSCPFCNKGFSHKSAFNFHVQTHSKERPYSCSVCGRSFTVEAYLKVHMKTHSADRPFSCSVCGARFGRNSSLQSHMMTH